MTMLIKPSILQVVNFSRFQSMLDLEIFDYYLAFMLYSLTIVSRAATGGMSALLADFHGGDVATA